MASTINQDVLEILRQCQCDGDALTITCGQIDRPLYLALDKVLQALGGKWNRKRRAHIFPGDAAEIIGDAVATGAYTDAKREFQLYETPEWLADDLVMRAGIGRGVLVLEPSAGPGRIARAARKAGGSVVCVELQESLANALCLDDFAVVCSDFLQIAVREVDAVVMNPPFTRSQDIQHVLRAWEWLRPGGRLVAIMAIGFTFRTDRRAREFREWLQSVGGDYEPLPTDAFKESGTGVSTVLLEVQK